MGTALTGSSVASTYDALLKITDNGPVGGTAKVVTDGLGNDSCFKLGTTSAEFTGGLTGTTLSLSSTLAAGNTTITGTLSTTSTASFGGTATVSTSGSGAGFSIVRTGGSPSTFTMLNSGGEIVHDYNSVGYSLRISSTEVVQIRSTGLDVVGESRCDSFRIDAAPSASSATTTHKLGINCNGTTYYILLSNV